MKRVWFTWETQRRNAELANAFRAELCIFDFSSQGRLLRYAKSAWQTLRYLFQEKPLIVFAQCPSIVLCSLLAMMKYFLDFRFLIDAHNIAIESLSRKDLLGSLHRFALSKADSVIVSNQALTSIVERHGGRPLVLPDKLPLIEKCDSPLKDTVPILLFVCTFAADEPVEIFIQGALRNIGHDFRVYITGKKSKAGQLLKNEGDRIHFTDFLPHKEYDRLLCSADLVIDLTTRENCLVCGGYEAISVTRPLMLSDHRVNREMFPKGCLFVKNTAEDYSQKLREFFENREKYEREIVEMKSDFLARWDSFYQNVEQSLAEKHPKLA